MTANSVTQFPCIWIFWFVSIHSQGEKSESQSKSMIKENYTRCWLFSWAAIVFNFSSLFLLPFYFLLMSGLGMLHFDFSHRELIQIALDIFSPSVHYDGLLWRFSFIENVNIFGNCRLVVEGKKGKRVDWENIDLPVNAELNSDKKRLKRLLEKLKHNFMGKSRKLFLSQSTKNPSRSGANIKSDFQLQKIK